ncbi:IS30 family transposase [Lawsonibacter hominis]|nr:IS30 family transposase [Lawsonibacter hominis]
MPDRSARSARDTMILLLSRLTPDRVKSITPDRGSGFALYREFSAAAGTVPLYFADPHAPWQCGANENTSGRIRKCLPKGSDMGPASDKQIDSIIALLNLRAQKCLA